MKKIIIILAVLIVILILSSLIFKIGIGYLREGAINGLYWNEWSKITPELCKCVGLKGAKHCLGIYYNCQKVN